MAKWPAGPERHGANPPTHSSPHIQAYSAKKPPDLGQGLRRIGIYSHGKLYGKKMPLDLRSALKGRAPVHLS
eukprot:1466686-Prymnesium_polylepis.1